MKSVAPLLVCCLLAACAGRPPSAPPVPTVGEVELRQSAATPASWEQLDVGIEVFSVAAGRVGDGIGDRVFSEVRDNERHLIPFKLRERLVASNQWGAVRVLPQPDPSMDLTVSGTLLDSSGERLQLRIVARDSSGRLWLDQEYADSAGEADYPPMEALRERDRIPGGGRHSEPFEDLYDRIANDLLAVRSGLERASLEELRRISLMVYARDLSPERFADTLQQSDDGRLSLVSLPAAGDPMLQRVRDMRTRHHLFIDTVDEYYETLHEDMLDAYLIWRRYSFDQEREERAAAERGGQERTGASAGFLSLQQRYDRYRWSKIYEQEFRELAGGFIREAAPAILELNRQVHGLSGTMEEQYIQWRRILRQLFALENASD